VKKFPVVLGVVSIEMWGLWSSGTAHSSEFFSGSVSSAQLSPYRINGSFTTRGGGCYRNLRKGRSLY
jgi:hypothetical protein